MARYNTAPQTLEVTGETTFTYAFTGGIISLTGTPGYTVTMVSPVFFPGSRQTFYNATDDMITIETAAGQITGNGVTLGASIDIPTNSTYVLTSDGTNYVLTSALAGTTVFELPVTFNDTLNADAKVELNPLDANVEISPTGSGIVSINPQSSVSIQPGAQATIRPTGDLTLSSASGTVSLGDIGKTTSFPGNIEFTANNQTINMSPTGSGSVTIDPGGDTTIDAGGQLTISSSTLGEITNMSIGSSNPSTGAFTSLSAGGTAEFTANAVSSSTTSGSIIVTGGAGISGAVYAGSLNGPLGSGTRSAADVTNLDANGDVNFSKNVSSTNTTTGTLVVAGGVGVGGALHAGSIQNTPIGTSTRATASFTTLNANSTVDFTATTEATNATGDTGTLRVEGGASIAKRVYSGGGFQGAIGNVSRSTGAFTTLTANSTVTLSPGANVSISPTGSGTVTLSPAGGGSINNMSVGATTASTGRFTSITATSNASISGTLTVNGNQTLGNATSDSTVVKGSLQVDNGLNHNSTGATRVARGTNAQRPTGADGYIRYNTDIDCMEFSDGTTWRSLGPGFLYSDVSSNITASVWRCYFVDTNGGGRTITLPNSGLIKGDTIRFFDLRKTFDSNSLTVNPNGGRIQGDTGNMTVNTEGAAFELVYHSSTYGWRIFSI